MLKVLEDPDARERVRASLRAAHLALWPTALSVIEVVSTENPRVRSRLLSTMATIADGSPLLPLVNDLLRQVAQGLLNGHAEVELEPSELEWMIYEPERITDDHVRLAGEWLEQLQAPWDTAHSKARAEMRARIKKLGPGDPWGSIPAFLESQWSRVEQLDSFIDLEWAELDLPGKPPYAQLLANEPWRLYFEGIGATVYDRAVSAAMPKKVHVPDAMLLTYLGGRPRRILVTDDSTFRRLASAVLVSRYAQSRVMSTAEFVALAS